MRAVVRAAVGLWGAFSACGSEASPPVDDATVPFPTGGTAYRISHARLLDPHLYAEPLFVGCTDVTDDAPLGASSANQDIREAFSDDRDGDGFFDVGVVVAVKDGELFTANGRCATKRPLCVPDSSVPVTVSAITQQASGACFSPDAAHLSPADYQPPVTELPAACFRSEPFEQQFQLARTSVTFRHARIAAREGDGRLEGILVGFVTETEALQTPVRRKTLASFLPGAEDNCARHDDTDVGPDGEPGWWFFLEFEAVEVAVAKVLPFSVSGGGGGH